MKAGWFVYLAQCRDGSLYCGVTTDPGRRLATHNAGQGGAYTRSRLPVVLVYLETAPTRSTALQREAALKRLTRVQKLRLIKKSPLPVRERG